MSTYTPKQYHELNKKIMDLKLNIIQLLSEIQESDNDLQTKYNYLLTINSRVNKSENKLSDMGFVIQSNYLKKHLTEEQINNVKIICNSSENVD